MEKSTQNESGKRKHEEAGGGSATAAAAAAAAAGGAQAHPLLLLLEGVGKDPFTAWAADLVPLLTASRSFAHSPCLLKLFARLRFGPTGRTLLNAATLAGQPERCAELVRAGALPVLCSLQELRQAQAALRTAINDFDREESMAAAENSALEEQQGLGGALGGGWSEPPLCFGEDGPENASNYYPWDGVDTDRFLLPARALIKSMFYAGLDTRGLDLEARLTDASTRANAEQDFDEDNILDDFAIECYEDGREVLLRLANLPFAALLEQHRVVLVDRYGRHLQ
jgi:hypothetical protein